jgi:transcriptional regulator GlxA family with amidase domain
VPVKGYGGHSIEPHGSLAEASDSNVVLIPPIFNDIEQTLADETGLVAWLASFPRGSTLLASSGTGAFLLAEAGLLTGRRVTTNPAFSDLFARRYPSIQLALDERIIGDNMVICAGATTAYLKLAVHIIERLAGRPRPHDNEKVLQLQTWIEIHHGKPIRIEDMVNEAGMSVRQFEPPLSKRHRPVAAAVSSQGAE